MRHGNLLWTALSCLAVLACGATGEESKPLKVFILAGQSNMEGQAVVDLAGKDYNDGKGTLVSLMNDPASGTSSSTSRTRTGTGGFGTTSGCGTNLRVDRCGPGR